MPSQQLSDDIHSLRKDDPTGNGSIGAAASRDPIAAKTGQSLETDAGEASDSGGGGIASPLTEISRQTETITLTDTTGLIQFDVSAAKQITMRDSNNADVVFNYDIPTP